MHNLVSSPMAETIIIIVSPHILCTFLEFYQDLRDYCRHQILILIKFSAFYLICCSHFHYYLYYYDYYLIFMHTNEKKKVMHAYNIIL